MGAVCWVRHEHNILYDGKPLAARKDLLLDLLVRGKPGLVDVRPPWLTNVQWFALFFAGVVIGAVVALAHTHVR